MKHNSGLIRRMLLLLAASLALLASICAVAAEDSIRIAYIDPLSGPFANVGDAGLKQFQLIAERINARGGVLGRKLEIVPFDNKGNAQESLQILKEAADRGIHYLTQGNGSHVAGALISGVTKYNRRHPDNKLVYLNYAAVDPALTNDKCSFWHFRFDANSRMKLQAVTDYIALQEDIERVFLINQDYSHGQAVSRIAKKMLAEKRPDIEIVGDILHPVGKVKDFSPYIAEIRASGADAVITGNWGRDLTLLVKAGAQAGLNVDWYTYYAGGLGTPTGIGEAGAGNVYVVSEWQENLAAKYDKPEMREILETFEKRYNAGDFYYLRIRTELRMLKQAIEKAGTADPLAVAYALEGSSIKTPFGTATMRADSHQVLQPLFISQFTKDFLKYDSEDTGLGWKSVHRVDAEQTRMSTSCEMQRPARPEAG